MDRGVTLFGWLKIGAAAIGFFAAGCAHNHLSPPPPPAEKPPPENTLQNSVPHRAAIHGDVFDWDGSPLKIGEPLSKWFQTLGNPNRFVNRAGGMWVWDSLGLVVMGKYSDTGSTPISVRHAGCLWMLVQPMQDSSWPRKAFTSPLAMTLGHQGNPGADQPLLLGPSDWRSDTLKLDGRATLAQIRGSRSAWPLGFPTFSNRVSFRFSGTADEDSLQVIFFQGMLSENSNEAARSLSHPDSILALQAINKRHRPAPTHRLAIEGNQWLFNGQRLKFWDPLATWLDALGPPNRKRQSGSTLTLDWDSLGMEVSALETSFGEAYVATVRLVLTSAEDLPPGEKALRQERGLPVQGFPGELRLLGVLLDKRPASYREVRAQLPRGFDFFSQGHPLPTAASLFFPAPDGFRVGMHTVLKGDDVFDVMEFGASGITEWR